MRQPKGVSPLKRVLQNATLAGVLLAVAMLTGVIVRGGESTAQTRTSMGVDADPTGNTATSLGAIDLCVSVSTGNTFQVDVFVADVTDLLAWEAYFVYDTKVIEVVDREPPAFQDANPGSNVFEASEVLPDLDGRYRLAAVDLAQPPAPDSGSGVLMRLTLKAIGPGLSPASLPSVDVNGDGTIDLGPFLRDVHGDLIGDQDGDGYFDGQVFSAQIAVDMVCPADTVAPTATPASASPSPGLTASPAVETTPTPAETLIASPTATAPVTSPTPGETSPMEKEGPTWTSGPWIIGYVIGGLAVLLAGGVVLLAVTRRRVR